MEWPDHVITDLVDIILSNDKWKTKHLLTNTKTVKNSQYYSLVIDELNERNPTFNFNSKW